MTLQLTDVFTRLDDLREPDLVRVGGKTFNCARLRQAGFPVPDGLAVSSDVPDDDVLHLACDPWLDTVPADARFAVRSSGLGEDSAGHSFAGIHETQLNVERDQLVEAVLLCRRSADSAAANAYRAARQLSDDEPRIGVLVQQMVPAVSSGVAFTVNPITGADELVINAGRGLGEALVSGQIDPDEFVVRKSDLATLSSRIGATSAGIDNRSTLSAAQLNELGALLIAIERHYGAPQDIEWCHDGRQFWIVQSRPVTTTATHAASSASTASTANPKSDINLHSEIQNLRSPEIEWIRANLAEVLPDQLSPQALDIYVGLLDRCERAFFGKMMAPESELGPIIKAFHGRLYFNVTQLKHVATTIGAAPADTLRSLGHPEEIRPEDEIAKRPALGKLLPALPDVIRLIVNTMRAESIFHAHQRHTEKILARLTAINAETQADAAIVATFEQWLAEAATTLKTVFVMSGVQMYEDTLRKACACVGFPYGELVYPQLAAGQRSVSTQQAVDLVALANVARQEAQATRFLMQADEAFSGYRESLAGTRFLDRFDRFIELYGHRGRYESDWALPRLHENPAPALFAIRAHLGGRPEDPRLTAQRQEADAAAAWRAFEARLTRWQRWTVLPRVRSTMRKLKKQYGMREQVRSDLTRVVSRLRAWHLVLADRFVERGWIDTRDDYFLLHLDEVKRATADPQYGPGLKAIAAGRAAQLEAERDLRLPLLMRESELPALIHAGRIDAASVSPDAALTGLCVSPGAVEADVVVMRDPGEFAAMKRGAILVAPATDPSWTPLFTLASGVIVEVGGMLSHASTIAREYGLPALANVKHATSRLKTGDRLRLDASNGRAIRLERKAS